MGTDFPFSPKILRILKKDKFPGTVFTGGKTGHIAIPGISRKLILCEYSLRFVNIPRDSNGDGKLIQQSHPQPLLLLTQRLKQEGP